MDRVLKTEFAPLSLVGDRTDNWIQNPVVSASDYRPLAGYNNNYWVSEHKLDLSGYTMDDLTVYFRNSFEQRGGETVTTWFAAGVAVNVYNVAWIELTIMSSVPMTDDNLAAAALTSPGFIPSKITNVTYGNFDRTHIIHGSRLLWQIDTSLAPDLDREGGAYNVVVQSNDFSSLEPTAADAIYCYRVIFLPDSGGDPDIGLTSVGLPAKRVLLNATTEAEPELEYMMRLKRSYELANQV